jgi:predicted transcriptional regulator
VNENEKITAAPAVNSIELTTSIVSAYVSNNHVQGAELATLIASTHAALAGLGKGAEMEATAVEKLTPAQIRKSITPDALISFIDGKPYKTLKRHLSGNGLTIEQYRERYGLPRDYPSTAASYSEQRSKLALSFGLGQQRKKAAPKAASPADTISEKPKRAGRPRKAREPAEA